METRIQNDLKMFQDRGLVIHDMDKILWYLKKVGYHRLSAYFEVSWWDSELLISYYIFDKRLRLLILDMLEVVENALKSVMYYHLGENFKTNHWYLMEGIYIDTYWEQRMAFIDQKTEEFKKNDISTKNYFNKFPIEKYLPDYLFFDKLTFWELIKTFQDLQIAYQKQVTNYYGVNVKVFYNWITALKHLRNLCSHYEYVFNRTMTFTVMGYGIKDSLWSVNSFISYLMILSIFQKILIPSYNRSSKICDLMVKFNISLEQIWYKKENLPSKHTSFDIEAREVLVNIVYSKNVKNARLFN